eukprot:3566523-Prymnesium_polylepis.1
MTPSKSSSAHQKQALTTGAGRPRRRRVKGNGCFHGRRAACDPREGDCACCGGSGARNAA